MQGLQSIPGTGHIFGVSGGGVLPGGGGGAAAAVAADRQLRPHPQQNLKCPRCDSHNTKFCYYNNYNLSQPRHFCKSCRRYWTKGGVLRNVPIGGGCRKSKRSSSSSSSSSSKQSAKSSSNGCKDSRHHSPADAASHSSSDSSTLTAATADAATVTQDPVTDDPGLDSYATALLESIHGGAAASAADDRVFAGTGSFTGLIAAAANPDDLGHNFGNGSQLHPPPALQQPKMSPPPPPPPARAGVVVDDGMRMPGFPVYQRYMDQMVQVDQMVQIDWQGGMDVPAGLFDAAGDHGGHWNHGQWGEIDPSLFLP